MPRRPDRPGTRTGLVAVVVASAVLGVDAVRTGDWQQVVGVTVALLVIVPLFRLLNRPGRRVRLRAVKRSE